MGVFRFVSYQYNEASCVASFRYAVNEFYFLESVQFTPSQDFDKVRLNSALQLAFILLGVSYYKTFPSRSVDLGGIKLDAWQADFFNAVYQEGLSQFAFENSLTRQDLALFSGAGELKTAGRYEGEGIIALQSGGKDSLLTATLLQHASIDYTAWYLSNSGKYPGVLDQLGVPLLISRRKIDVETLKFAEAQGAKNGHVPVTYIVASLALIQAILVNKNQILLSIGHEGEESHARIGDLDVTHQWSKTWSAEQLLTTYVNRYVSGDIFIGSPLRHLSELKIAELFTAHCWERFGKSFSSCNRANYKVGSDNTTLQWCGNCPKCANSYLLFAPWLEAANLKDIFGGQELFAKKELHKTFAGLLGVDGQMKPFECIGEIGELRLAYHKAMKKGGYEELPFVVPLADYDYDLEHESQSVITRTIFS